MRIYSVHVPAAAGAVDRVHFERQGFSWPAFLLGPLWLIGRGLWRALALWCLAVILVGLAVGFGRLTGGAAFALLAIIELYLGLEASVLAAAALDGAGWRLTDVAAGADRIDAERSFFSRRTREAQPTAAGVRQAASPLSQPPSIIGLFPETGG